MRSLLRRALVLALIGAAACLAWRWWSGRTTEAAAPAEWPPLADEATTVPVAATAQWVAPVDGQCPDGYPVKVNAGSGIYHVPGGRFYARTAPDRCYVDPGAAEADGYRAAKA